MLQKKIFLLPNIPNNYLQQKCYPDLTLGMLSDRWSLITKLAEMTSDL